MVYNYPFKYVLTPVCLEEGACVEFWGTGWFIDPLEITMLHDGATVCPKMIQWLI